MSLKSFRDNPIYAVILLYTYVLISTRLPFGGMFLISYLWYLKTKDKSWLIVLLCTLLLWLPRFENSDSKVKEATVMQVHQNYSVIYSGRKKVIVYGEPLPLDARVSVDGNLTPVTYSPSFFGFDFAAYLDNHGIFYSLDAESVTVEQERMTIRRLIQKRITSIENTELLTFENKVLLNIQDTETLSGSFLSMSGFSLAGIMRLLENLLKRIISRNRRKKIMTSVNLILILIYGPKMILISALIRRLLSFSKLKSRERSCLSLIFTILIYQRETISSAFLYPAVYLLLKHPVSRIAASFTIQSVINSRIDPLQAVLFPVWMLMGGVLWFYGMLILMIPKAAVIPVIHLLNQLNLISDPISLKGNMLGPGLPLFLLVAWRIRKIKYSQLLYLCTLIGFLLTGMFHPFAEVCFINVGQGDSILIRGPLQTANILIDTGKPSKYSSVQSALDARSIYHLDGFFITHSDSDHAGSKNEIIRDYNPSEVIDSHIDCSEIRNLIFYDLNRIDDESDENRSSIVLLFSLNHLTYLMMGDADTITEEDIVHRYSSLHCDILKLSHHGSATGSCSLFLDTVRPDLGIVSSGAYSIYHHPSKETVQRLLQRHIPYLDTKDHGDISILCIGPFNLLLCADGTVDLLS